MKEFDCISEYIVQINRVGSRETCSPPPIDTDEDWLVLVKPKDFIACFDLLIKDEWNLNETSAQYDGPDEHTSLFCSLRKEELNIIITFNPEFHQKFLDATAIAKRDNLMYKNDRIKLFKKILYEEEETKWPPSANGMESLPT